MILPPGIFCVLILICLAFRRYKTAGRLLLVTGALFYLASLPATLAWLGSFLQTNPSFPLTNHDSEAIVVLGGGHYINTPDYGGDTVNHLTLERLRYAARLQKQTGLPILVSGGVPFHGISSEAELMHAVLTREFKCKVQWVEANSRTTFENAQFSAGILKTMGIKKIALVTHTYHMPRALEAFQRSGLSVTPAPTIFFDLKPAAPTYTAWLPSANATYRNSLIIHELIGRLWYHIHYYRTIPETLWR